MDFDDEESSFTSALPPALVSLIHFTPSISPSRRRLSGCFTQPAKPIRAKKQLAWLSLQGRLVGAEEATSAKTIDGNSTLSPEAAAAWELFTPFQRVLIVAVVAAAAANSKKNHQIIKLQKSVEIRDKVLLSMQQKLDSLCQQMNYLKDESEVVAFKDVSVAKKMACGCKSCQHHASHPNEIMDHTSTKGSDEDEMLKYKTLPTSVSEQEERRMSDLSDWAPSVASVDQLDISVYEPDINSLQKQCVEKDATIKKFLEIVQSTGVLGSKRTMELEDIIRRKNMIINKLRKDILVLEQKVICFTRLRRPSFSSASSYKKPSIPLMADNVLYDIDSTTSPSSSDSDSPLKTQIPGILKTLEVSVQPTGKSAKSDEKYVRLKDSALAERHLGSSAASPLKERSLNETPSSVPAMKPKHVWTTTSGENRTRRRPARSKEPTAAKRLRKNCILVQVERSFGFSMYLCRGPCLSPIYEF